MLPWKDLALQIHDSCPKSRYGKCAACSRDWMLNGILNKYLLIFVTKAKSNIKPLVLVEYDGSRNLLASLTAAISDNHPAVWPRSPLLVAELSALLTLMHCLKLYPA